MLDLPVTTRLRGTYILGKNGTGKSSLLVSMIAKDLIDGRGLCILDPHGDLIVDALAALGILAPTRARDVILLDLQNTQCPFGFNLFACENRKDPLQVAETAELVSAVFRRVWGDAIGPRSLDLLENTVYALVATPGATLADVPEFLTKDRARERYLRNVTNPVVRAYWENEYNVLSPGQQQQIIAPLLNKVRAFLRHPVLYQVVSQDTAPDIASILDKNKILLVRLSARLEEATNLLGTMLTLRLLHGALGRADQSQRNPFFLYADEFQRFATEDFGTLLQEARKFGIGTVLAHQLRSQLSRELRSGVLGAGTIVCFQLTAEDARELERELPHPHGTPALFLPDYDRRDAWSLAEKDVRSWLLTHDHPWPEMKERTARIRETMLALISFALPYPLWKDQVKDRLAKINHSLAYAIILEKPERFVIDPPVYVKDYPREAYRKLKEAIAHLQFEIQYALEFLFDPARAALDRLPILIARVRSENRTRYLRVSHLVQLGTREEVLSVLSGNPPTGRVGAMVHQIRERNCVTPKVLEEDVFPDEPPPLPTAPKRRRIFE